MDGKYENIEIRFFHPDGEEDLIGTVLVRADGDEMVIDTHGDYHYLLRGFLDGHCYQATNADPDAQSQVCATWTRLPDIYVGVWIEDGDEYMFSFRLPARPMRKTP